MGRMIEKYDKLSQCLILTPGSIMGHKRSSVTYFHSEGTISYCNPCHALPNKTTDALKLLHFSRSWMSTEIAPQDLGSRMDDSVRWVFVSKCVTGLSAVKMPIHFVYLYLWPRGSSFTRCQHHGLWFAWGWNRFSIELSFFSQPLPM